MMPDLNVDSFLALRMDGATRLGAESPSHRLEGWLSNRTGVTKCACETLYGVFVTAGAIVCFIPGCLYCCFGPKPAPLPPPKEV